MSSMNLYIIVTIAVISVSFYGLRSYLKGNMCHLQNRIDEKVVLITGANVGIGLETAVELAKRGGIIHMGCRDQVKCKNARETVLARSLVSENRVFCHIIDLASLSSIINFVKQFKKSVKKLNILINNAGVMMNDYEETEDGFEKHIGVNHLGHFLLTNELLDIIKTAEDPRILIISSVTHQYGSFNTADINVKLEDYGRLKAYQQSKLANVLHARYLSKVLKQHNVASVSIHPGVVNTELLRYIPILKYLNKYGTFLLDNIMKTPFEGAQTSVCCAVNPDLFRFSGEYFSDCQPVKSENPEVYNDTLVDLVWQQSTNLIKSKLRPNVL